MNCFCTNLFTDKMKIMELFFFGNSNNTDIIIPADIAKPILYLTQILLITSILSLFANMWTMFSLTILLYITSSCYWNNPKKGFCRTADYLMVLSNSIYITYVTFQQTTIYKYAGFFTLMLLLTIFIKNEYKFWSIINKQKKDYYNVIYGHIPIHLIANTYIWFLLYGIIN